MTEAQSKPKILFICGSLHQTIQMHQISAELPEFDHFFSPHYADGFTELIRKLRWTEMSVLGKKHFDRCMSYLEKNELKADYRGESHDYDLIVTCSDMVIQKNIRNKKIVVVQEGMTDPDEFWFYVVMLIPTLPRWAASTATTGMSNMYDRFCVASEGYKDHFIQRGADPSRLIVTGIPNFDNVEKFKNNSFPYRDFVLVCTSDSRETLKIEDRSAFIRKCLDIAGGRQLIFKLHPNENYRRSIREIQKLAPDAIIYTSGSAEEMIANCSVLITQYSSVSFVGIALGKEVHSYFDLEDLKRKLPVQNQSAAKNIAKVVRDVHESPDFIHPKKLNNRLFYYRRILDLFSGKSK